MEKIGELVVLSGADPLNMVGILTPDSRIAAIHRSKLLLKDGIPIAALEGGEVRRLAQSDYEEHELKAFLQRRSLRQPLQPHLRTATAKEARALSRVVH
jgi:ATP-dependent Lhr-like helicase